MTIKSTKLSALLLASLSVIASVIIPDRPVQAVLVLDPPVALSQDNRLSPLDSGIDNHTDTDSDIDLDHDWLNDVAMNIRPLHISGSWDTKYDLTFFSDGYTKEEETKFFQDAKILTADILSPGGSGSGSGSGAMAHVADLLNVYAVFIPSEISGVSSSYPPNKGAAFGLYRPSNELRAVFVEHEKRARMVCRFWRQKGEKAGRGGGGCDQPILLGNDPLYGGLGGEFTIITASKLNGPLVLRHELGHSLIDVGEEYEGGYAYFGPNSAPPSSLSNLPWSSYLSQPSDSVPARIEDAQTPLQAYPWHDLSAPSSSSSPSAVWQKTFTLLPPSRYPTGLFAASVSSLPFANHLSITIDGTELDLRNAYKEANERDQGWDGSLDRRWLVVPLAFEFMDTLYKGKGGGGDARSDRSALEDLDRGMATSKEVEGRNVTIKVELTDKGRQAQAGQGGKVLSSVELIQYGTPDRFNSTVHNIAAYPTYAEDGSIHLRPTNEGCLMRRVNYPAFCKVCQHALKKALVRKIAAKSTT